MHIRSFSVLFAILSMSACAIAPSASETASLPVVVFPGQPPKGDFVLKFPAGKTIPINVSIEGTALANDARQTLNVTLPHDLYVHRRWVSGDGRHWKSAGDVLGITMTVSIPSYQFPKPGEIVLRVDRKDVK